MQLPRARQEFLLREVELRGSARSAEVAERLGVSEVTIRRDIIELDRAGKLARVHGGAVARRSARGPEAARAIVGVMVPSTTHHFPPLIRGMEALAPELRVRLVLGVSHYHPEVERTQVERLVALGAAGLAIAPTTHRRHVADVVAWATSIPIPVVLVERSLDDVAGGRELDVVRTDHVHGATLGVEHLARLGHERIGLAVYDRTPTAPSVRDGFARAVGSLGLSPGPDAALPKGEEDPAALTDVLARFLGECRESGTRAVLAHTDYHAARLVETALDRGWRIPEDLAVVAYDDENAELAAVPLTAVTPPRLEVGREALQLLVDRVNAPDPASRPTRHLDLLPWLTVRASCGARV